MFLLVKRERKNKLSGHWLYPRCPCSRKDTTSAATTYLRVAQSVVTLHNLYGIFPDQIGIERGYDWNHPLAIFHSFDGESNHWSTPGECGIAFSFSLLAGRRMGAVGFPATSSWPCSPSGSHCMDQGTNGVPVVIYVCYMGLAE